MDPSLTCIGLADRIEERASNLARFIRGEVAQMEDVCDTPGRCMTEKERMRYLATRRQFTGRHLVDQSQALLHELVDLPARVEEQVWGACNNKGLLSGVRRLPLHLVDTLGGITQQRPHARRCCLRGGGQESNSAPSGREAAQVRRRGVGKEVACVDDMGG